MSELGFGRINDILGNRNEASSVFRRLHFYKKIPYPNNPKHPQNHGSDSFGYSFEKE